MLPKIFLKKNKEKPLLNRHPWIFSGALQPPKEPIKAGNIVDVVSCSGQFLARGYYNDKSQIRVRALTWDAHQQIDKDFWQAKIEQAKTLRDAVIDHHATNAFRLISSEADGMPGLVVDKYDTTLVVQSSTAGMDAQLGIVFEILKELYPDHTIIERSDDDVRKLEGLEKRSAIICGPSHPKGRIEILENNLKFIVDVMTGHKTGFYVDQRENRRELMNWTKDKAVLNCFGYTGAFSVASASANAKSVVTVDSSDSALELTKENLKLNGFDDDARSPTVRANVFELLRQYKNENKKFDVIVLDPPKLVFNAAQINSAARAYKDLNRLAFGLLNSGGILMTFSCSGLVSADLFQKIVFSAAIEANVTASILKRLTQGPDHPVLLSFPESDYLKGLVCRVC